MPLRFITLFPTSSGIAELDCTSGLFDLAVLKLHVVRLVPRFFVEIRQQGDLSHVDGSLGCHVSLKSAMGPPWPCSMHRAEGKPMIHPNKICSRSDRSGKFRSLLRSHWNGCDWSRTDKSKRDDSSHEQQSNQHQCRGSSNTFCRWRRY